MLYKILKIFYKFLVKFSVNLSPTLWYNVFPHRQFSNLSSIQLCSMTSYYPLWVLNIPFTLNNYAIKTSPISHILSLLQTPLFYIRSSLMSLKSRHKCNWKMIENSFKIWKCWSVYEEFHRSDKSVALKHFPNKTKTTVLSFLSSHVLCLLKNKGATIFHQGNVIWSNTKDERKN